jgi:hypothetical protein
MNDENIAFFASVSNTVVSKNKNSIDDIFDGKNLAVVPGTDTLAMPLISAAGINCQRQIFIKSGIVFKGMKRVNAIIISP